MVKVAVSEPQALGKQETKPNCLFSPPSIDLDHLQCYIILETTAYSVAKSNNQSS